MGKKLAPSLVVIDTNVLVSGLLSPYGEIGRAHV